MGAVEARCGAYECCQVLNAPFEGGAAVSTSPGVTVMLEIVTVPRGYISHQA